MPACRDDDYISKPINIRAVTEALERVCEIKDELNAQSSWPGDIELRNISRKRRRAAQEVPAPEDH